jgi:hypothetical protein
MKRISYIIGIVLLFGAAAKEASALTYVTVLTPAERRQLTTEYNTLQAQRRQTQTDLNNMCRVVRNSREMFVYSLNGSNRWEFWTTNQVAARLRQISRTQTAYNQWWKYLAGQHLNYSRYVGSQLIPSLHAKLDRINKRLADISGLLASDENNKKRPNLTNVTVNTSPVHIRIWDHGKQDGDIVQIFLNGRFLRELRLVKNGTTLTLPLKFGNHRLQVVAMNTGDEGPNTASVKVTGVVKGKAQQSWELQKGEQTIMWITVGN